MRTSTDEVTTRTFTSAHDESGTMVNALKKYHMRYGKSVADVHAVVVKISASDLS